ncbi:hypothetical protein V8E51_014752 [Hyaloscypha variabilis]
MEPKDRDVRRFKGLCSLATNFCSLDSGLLAQEESCEFVGFSRLCGPLSPPCSSRFRASRFPISSSTTYDAIILSDGRLICSHLKARCLPGSQGKPVVTCKVRSCCVRSLLHECSTVFSNTNVFLIGNSTIHDPRFRNVPLSTCSKQYILHKSILKLWDLESKLRRSQLSLWHLSCSDYGRSRSVMGNVFSDHFFFCYTCH